MPTSRPAVYRGQTTPAKPHGGQQIPTGDVGLATFDDRYTSGAGGYSHQHGCGAWNTPTQVTGDLDVAEAAATEDRDVIADMASAAVERARRMLDEAGQEKAVERVREWLEHVADEVLAQFEAAPEGIEDRRVLDGSEIEPGAQVERDDFSRPVLLVWDYEPRDIYGDALVATRPLPDRARR